MGAHNIREIEDTQVSMISTDYIVHEAWDSSTLANDISVIRLPRPVDFDGQYYPFTLFLNKLFGSVVGWADSRVRPERPSLAAFKS